MADHWYKDPDDTLQYKFDFAPLTNGTGNSDWLDRTSSPVETISSTTVTAIDSPGPTIVSYAKADNDTTVAVVISGGSANAEYGILCEITTSTGQIKSKTATLVVSNQ